MYDQTMPIWVWVVGIAGSWGLYALATWQTHKADRAAARRNKARARALKH